MLGQAHTPRRRLLPSAAIALAVLVAPAVGGASGANRSASLHVREHALASKARAAVLDLYSLDARLSTGRSQLTSLSARAAVLRGERASLERRLAVARRSNRLAQARLGQQLRMLYEQGPISALDVVLGATSLDDAMSNLDSLNAASEANKQLVVQLEGARVQLLAARRALATHAAALAAERRQVAATVAALARTRAARTAYVASLARERQLTAKRIASITAQARAAVVRTARLQPSPAQPTRLQPGPTAAAGTKLTVSTTGYSLGGRTSSGLPVSWGVAAVDPSVIPLGTHMTIPGYGEAIAADTGSAIIGARVDLWFPTLAQARAWGRRTVTITLH